MAVKKKTTMPSPLILIFAIGVLSVSGCALILGKDDGISRGAMSGPVRIRHVETLRNQASLTGERYVPSTMISVPTSSLQRPTAVAADLFRVYVTDQSPIPRLVVFDRSTRSLSEYSAPTPTSLGTRFGDLSAVAVADVGNIFIADAQQGKVFALDRAGNLLLTIGNTGTLVSPAGLAVDGTRNRLYVADKHAHAIRIYSLHGDWLGDLTGEDAKKRLGAPAGVAVDSGGACYVLDLQDRRVHVFTRDGGLRHSFRIVSGVPADAVRPTGIAVDSDGHIYVSDGIGGRVLIYSNEGVFLQQWDGTGGLPDGFRSPGAIFIDKRDLIYIADQLNGFIQVYQYEK